MATRKPAAPPSTPSKKPRVPADRPPGVRPPGHHKLTQATVQGKRELPHDPNLDPAFSAVQLTPDGQHITPTVTPGVWRNAWQQYVDATGRLLSIPDLRALEAEHDIQVLGHVATSPADLLRRVALDPRYSMDVRLDAAHKAAPYYDKKQPLSTEITELPPPGAAGMDMSALAALPKDERESFINTLRKLGFGV
jgi:hypothetical protein